jgi:alpha-beta hydrolase superfamily lysophospholipase
MRFARGIKRVGAACVLGFVVLNVAAYQQSRAFVRFSPVGHRTPPPHKLSAVQKARVLLTGVEVPRPVNRRTPLDHGFTYERHVFAGAHGVPLEAWLIPRVGARGTVVLFHGHAASKDSQLREATAFHRMGLRAFLVDFHGSGGSGGDETSIGYCEAVDVAEAFAYARDLPGSGPVVLYGASMGAAAVIKGVADGALDPAALVLECPFDSLLNTVRHRFTTMGIPAFPAAHLLVFWGGVHAGFNGFRHRPVESASLVDSPTLLMSGEEDPWVTPEESRAIFNGLRGPKTLKLFSGVAHDSCLRRRPDDWKRTVSAFLSQVLDPPPAGAEANRFSSEPARAAK